MANNRLLWVFFTNFFHTRVFTMLILNYGGFVSYILINYLLRKTDFYLSSKRRVYSYEVILDSRGLDRT